MQPKLKSKVLCSDSEVGEVRRVIMDPLSHEVSDIVVGGAATGSVERQVPMGQVQSVTVDAVILRCSSAEFAAFPIFKNVGPILIADFLMKARASFCHEP